MPTPTYNTNVYMDQNGNELVVASGGKVTVLPGGVIGSNAYSPITRPTIGGFDTATFANYFPFAIYRDGGNHIQTNFDWRKVAPNVAVPTSGVVGPGVNVYYASLSGADTNTGASWAQAFASINKAITTGNAAAAPYCVYVQAGLYQFYTNYGGPSGAAVPSQACAFIAVGGKVVSSQSFPNAAYLGFSLTSGTTYQMPGTIYGNQTVAKIQRLVDLANLTQYGEYTEYPKAATLAACEATPGTWFSDATNVYVNRTDAQLPTYSNIRMFFNTQVASQTTTSGNQYVENFDFEGGENNTVACKGNAAGRMVFVTCSSKWSSGAAPASDINWGLFDVDAVYFDRCTTAHGQNDGIASHKVNGKIAFYAAIGCIGHHQGSPLAYSCNAVTSHDGGRSISINGTYWSCQGGQSAHVIANTQHWSIGDACHSSLGDIAQGGTAPPSDWLADQSNATIWIDSGASAPGATNAAGYYSLYTDSAGGSDTANIYYRNCNLAGAIGPNCSPY